MGCKEPGMSAQLKNNWFADFPGDPVVKNLSANAGDMDSIPGQEDFTFHVATKPMCQNYWAHMI